MNKCSGTFTLPPAGTRIAPTRLKPDAAASILPIETRGVTHALRSHVETVRPGSEAGSERGPGHDESRRPRLLPHARDLSGDDRDAQSHPFPPDSESRGIDHEPPETGAARGSCEPLHEHGPRSRVPATRRIAFLRPPFD